MTSASRIERALKELGTPERAAGEKRYLKSDLAFLGCTLGDMRRIAKDVSKEPFAHDGLIELVEDLWSKPVFDRRMVAVILLELHPELLGPKDLPLVERLVRESGTWALVDGLAGVVAGRIAAGHRVKGVLDGWSRDDDFWVRRASLLAELKPLKEGAAFAAFGARADRMLEEKEFFIRKAIGWVLRETSKERPGEVYEWILPRAHRASGVTIREAVKHLDAARAERVTDRYKGGPARG